jgi:hypothetical protein
VTITTEVPAEEVMTEEKVDTVIGADGKVTITREVTKTVKVTATATPTAGH